MQMTEVGEVVYNRTYARTKPDGTKETWPETVERVVDGNLALTDTRYNLPNERDDLIKMINEFKLLPAGRHLWASGVPNSQHLFNCWHSGFPDNIAEHFSFTFMRLMEGGGVGANYSNVYLENYPKIANELQVEVVCDPEHPDYAAMEAAGILSQHYDADWPGSFPIEDSREGWAAALVDLISTFYRTGTVHHQRVYDVSRIRKAGAKLKTFGGHASGPLPFAEMLHKVANVFSANYSKKLTGISAMEVDHAIAECVVAGGVRRSARMAVMHWKDPQIHKFINSKSESGSHWTTNISVVVDNQFWKLVKGQPDDDVDFDTNWALAQEVMSALSEGALRNGEPGMWDISLSNVGEPNTVTCVNPCAEITLEEWEPCCLGHINLAAFVDSKGRCSLSELYKAHVLMTRFLIRATFATVGDQKSREALDRNRRIGVGHLGVASFLAMQGRRYSETPNDSYMPIFLSSLAKKVDNAAIEFCHDLRIPVPVKKRTVAPTGTISKLVGVSEGIHPIFSKYFYRRIRFNKHSDSAALDELLMQGYDVEDDLFAPNTAVVTIPTKDTLVELVTDIYGESGEQYVEAANDLSLDEMIAFQAMYQTCWADNAVSFTANVNPDAYTAKQVADVLIEYSGEIKGATIFPEASFPQAPYERITKQQYLDAAVHEISDGVDEECASGACPIR